MIKQHSGVVRAVPAEVRSKNVRYKEVGTPDLPPQPPLPREQRAPSAKRTTFAPGNNLNNGVQPEFKRPDNHFGQVRTGHVNEKRNFWMRSASVEKLHEGSPGPARRRRALGGESWIRQASEGPARPGSSLGQVISSGNGEQSVKTTVSGWGELSKSKSSAAVLQEENRKRRALSKDRFVPNAHDQVDNQQKTVNLSDAHTHQVQETVDKWGKPYDPQPVEKRVTTPTRHIGETFQENKVHEQHQEEVKLNVHNQSAPWRSKNAEPSVKVVNVAVENNNSSNGGANMRFSESAEAMMAKHMKQQSTSSTSSCEVKQSSTSSMSTSTTLMSSSSSSTMTSEHQKSVVTQPPPKSPGPIRKSQQQSQQPSKGKSVPSASTPRPSTQPPSEQPQALLPPPASTATPKAVSSTSSGQVSMLSTTTSTASSQEWQQQQKSESTHEYQESSSCTSMMMSTTSNSNQSGSLMTEAPTLSGWLAEEKQQPLQSTPPNNVQQSKQPPQPPKTIQKDPQPPEPNVMIPQPPEPKTMPQPPPMETSAPPSETSASGTKITSLPEDPRANTDFLDARSKMLKEVASLRIDTASEEEDEDIFGTSQEKAAEKAKSDRARELAEIAEMRCRTNWQDIVHQNQNESATSRMTPTKSVDPELEEARKTIRNAAAKWQEREQKTTPEVRYGTPPSGGSGRTTPSRRIGNLFKKGSDHFSMDADEEEFPAPPLDIEMEVILPAPPPRESSKDVMMEYGANGKIKN